MPNQREVIRQRASDLERGFPTAGNPVSPEAPQTTGRPADPLFGAIFDLLTSISNPAVSGEEVTPEPALPDPAPFIEQLATPDPDHDVKVIIEKNLVKRHPDVDVKHPGK